jgi:SAM-dependent methyltransferase
MLTRLLIFLCNVSPALRRVLWRWWYSKLAREVPTDRWTLMNYGFAPADEPPLSLDERDEPERLSIQLYVRVARPADLAGAEVLEVGSGRGGGASYLARSRHPARYTGIDFSPQAAAFCAERHRDVENLRFTIGDAEHLPFPDTAFDAVINVESSHCYGNVPQFFAEVHRVLRPGGWFLFADLRDPKDAAELEVALRALPWSSVEKEDITADVLRALDLDDARKRKMIEQWIPAGLRSVFGEFAGLSGGKVSRSLRNGDLVYLRFAARK